MNRQDVEDKIHGVLVEEETTTDTVAALLARIEPLVDAVNETDYGYSAFGVEIVLHDGEVIEDDQRRLLGAINDHCVRNEWGYVKRWNPSVGFEVMIRDKAGQSDESECFAALAALDAALASVCPTCDGYGEVGGWQGVLYPCPDCRPEATP